MTLQPFSGPIVRCKQSDLDVQDLTGLLRIHWRIGSVTLFSAFYTRIDQVFLLWGWVTVAIFATAQFTALSWHLLAAIASTLSLAVTLGMSYLAWYWVRVEQLRWVVYWWGILVTAGLAVTDYSILAGWGLGLSNLCPLWLGLSALGYGLMGWQMRSRSFLAAAMLHWLAIPVLPLIPDWQFMATGGIMASCLLMLAELQWDMRPPIHAEILTPEQQAFNRQQQQRRQM
jgi:hypothetical protein